MDLSILIKILLNDHETVIIPGLGAFVSVYKPAVIRENDIIPPGKEIRFFHQIKSNDGLLAMHIARSKKISYDDAFKRIERASSKIIYELDKGEKVAFGDLGEFYYNENGEIEFTKFESSALISPAGFEPVFLDDVIETPEETRAEQVVESESFVAEESEIEAVEVEQNLPEQEEIIQKEVLDEDLHETETPEPQIPLSDNEEPAERKKSIAWLWISLLIVAILVVAFFFIKERMVTPKNAEPSEITVEVAQPEVTKTDSIQPAADTVAAAVVQPPVTSSALKYHLVGGGFKSEGNAIKYIDQLEEKGIEGTLLGQNGSLFLVGIASFNTKEEAIAELNRRAQQDPDWKLWVYQK